MNSVSNTLEKKITRKQRRCQHTLEKETGINSCSGPTKNIAICNAGLVNGLTKELVLKYFISYGEIEDIILLPHKSCSFVIFKNISDAEQAYNNIHGKLNIAQYNKPLYLTYTESVPENLKLQNDKLPEGLILIENFISLDEENLLLSLLDKDETISSSMKHRRVKHFGYEFRYDINNVDKNCPLPEKIPSLCNFIFERVCSDTKFSNFMPDQLTINDYQPGQGIPSHVDTHSAFEDPILSLSTYSDVIMEFKSDTGQHVSVLLPRRSLLIMSEESRYAWTHGITPRKLDVISTENGLTSKERGRRISFTFRKVLQGNCSCKYPAHCDSQRIKIKTTTNIESSLAAKLEEQHVHEIYEKISGHFSETRHKPWPNVLNFVNSFPIGSILVDIGCGNGKYLGHNKNIFEIGCDRSSNLIEICNTKGFQAFNCNCLQVPIRDNMVDATISIAVIHHLANEERRLQAIKEMGRILKIEGQALIYVWAKNQEKHKKSMYLKQDITNPNSKIDTQTVETVKITKDVSLPVHINRTQFKNQDMLVPWKLKKSKDKLDKDTKLEEGKNLFLRYYHLFEEGELELLCSKVENINVIKSFYDEGNWCVIFKKTC